MWNELNIRLTKCSQCNSCNPVYIPVGQASCFPLLPAFVLGKANIICNESGIHLLIELCARKWISIFPKRFILLQKRSWLSLVVAVISPNWVQSGLGIWCRQRELCLPETKKLIYIRMGWRLRPLRVLWIWGIKHNGFHVGLSFTSPLLERGTQSWEQIWFIPRLKNWHMHVPEGSHSAKHMHTTHAHICYACIYLNSSSPGWAMVPKLSELKCLLSSPKCIFMKILHFYFTLLWFLKHGTQKIIKTANKYNARHSKCCVRQSGTVRNKIRGLFFVKSLKNCLPWLHFED